MTTKSQLQTGVLYPARPRGGLANGFAKGGARPPGGFSLVELLTVIAILAAMMALVVPATKGLFGSTGRKGAVNQLLNTFEQARVAALESGAPVYILLWRRDFPNKDAYMVLRKGTESDLIGTSTTPPDFVYLTGWRSLPKGIVFYDPESSSSGNLSVLSSGLPGEFDDKVASLPMEPAEAGLAAIKFNESGIIQHPSAGTPLALYIGEGTRTSATSERLTQSAGSSGSEDALNISGGLTVTPQLPDPPPDPLPTSNRLAKVEVRLETPSVAASANRRSYVFVTLIGE